MNRGNPEDVPLWAWILIAVILLTQGTWLFLDARKREKRAWFWGMWGTIQFPWPLIIYSFAVLKIHRRWKRNTDGGKKK